MLKNKAQVTILSYSVATLSALYEFFEDFKDRLDIKSPDYKNTKWILDYLEKCFPACQGGYSYLSKHTWVHAVFTLIHKLRKDNYLLTGEHSKIGAFIRDFHYRVGKPDERNSNIDCRDFYNSIRSSWSAKVITDRREILVKALLAAPQCRLRKLDSRRQISEEEKIALFADHPTCEDCGREFRDHSEPEYHHDEPHGEGGRTHVTNIKVLCDDCHRA